MRGFRTALALMVPALALQGVALAQAVSFPNFPNNFDLVLNGDADVTAGVLRVAPDINTQSGSA